jgi:hypothetical protein
MKKRSPCYLGCEKRKFAENCFMFLIALFFHFTTTVAGYTARVCIYLDVIFFLNAIPVFGHTAFTVPFRSAVFPFQFLFFCLSSPSFRWCDGAPGHFPRPPTPIPPHIHRHTQHLYTHGRLFPTGLEPVLTSRWWSKKCRSSFHHHSVSP